ncbi:MAG: triose-phosphate isomerase [Cyanobacteria bacterium NC_groundwater_1444_Ag_S-0.65um_54_12]|nr:triose-phosphate isomerase [Cyanobacteria bacterium NC_groundwater_1444_Ag_S-0.65um_54_12]
MVSRKPIIAGNWKMYKTISEARDFARALAIAVRNVMGLEVVLCPPFTTLFALREELAGTAVQLGGQNCYFYDEGAFTGEVSPRMLRDAGCTYVVLGHSERRQHFAETDGSVNKKVHAALAHGLTPIICVGEKAEEREVQLTDNVVIVQVQRALLNLEPLAASQVCFAYEPIWAIGTGKTCDSREANRVCAIIRETMTRQVGPGAADDVRILYGGSVKPDTIAGKMAQPHIDGALVGGASLDPHSFAQIVEFNSVLKKS